MNYTACPTDYQFYKKIDLQNDKKLALLVNGLCLTITLVMAAVGIFFVPISFSFKGEEIPKLFFNLIAFLAACVVYIILHELTHGFFMKRYSGIKPHFGFTGLYAFAGSDAFFDKKSYLIIGLSPVVLWGTVLLVLQFLVPQNWFWFVYLIQIFNISGAAGDFYVTWLMTTLPKDLLIQDDGTAMSIYKKKF